MIFNLVHIVFTYWKWKEINIHLGINEKKEVELIQFELSKCNNEMGPDMNHFFLVLCRKWGPENAISG